MLRGCGGIARMARTFSFALRADLNEHTPQLVLRRQDLALLTKQLGAVRSEPDAEFEGRDALRPPVLRWIRHTEIHEAGNLAARCGGIAHGSNRIRPYPVGSVRPAHDVFLLVLDHVCAGSELAVIV